MYTDEEIRTETTIWPRHMILFSFLFILIGDNVTCYIYKWYFSFFCFCFYSFEVNKRFRVFKKLIFLMQIHVAGIDGVSCNKSVRGDNTGNHTGNRCRQKIWGVNNNEIIASHIFLHLNIDTSLGLGRCPLFEVGNSSKWVRTRCRDCFTELAPTSNFYSTCSKNAKFHIVWEICTVRDSS